MTYAAEPGSDRVLVTVDAGRSWPELADELVADGLSGAETMVGIPGTVGAMPVQNVGAYGQEIADVLVGVTAWDWHHQRVVHFDNAGCELTHRRSRFKRTHRWMILRVDLALTKNQPAAPVRYRQVAEVLGVQLGARPPLADVAAAVRHVRARKGMLAGQQDADARTVGSVFLSPSIDLSRKPMVNLHQAPVNNFPDGSTRISASWLMRRSGFTPGQRLTPGVRMSGKHLTLAADTGATSASFVAATRQIQDVVLRTTGILLDPEPDPVGDLPGYGDPTRP